MFSLCVLKKPCSSCPDSTRESKRSRVAFNRINNSKEMYVKHRNVWTRDKRQSPSAPAGGAALPAVASSRTPTDCWYSRPRRVWGTGCSVWKHRAFFWCLDLGAALLVPPSLWKDPLFNMFTMAALKPHRFSVFALLFISFPSLLLAQDVFKNAHDNVVSLVCAWRVKIKYKRLKKKRSY